MNRFETDKGRRCALAAMAAMAAALAVAACGGGGGDVGGTAGALTVGPVSGFGSIIVNGVRFEDNAARVLDDNGNDAPSSSIRLGSMVEIESSRIDDGSNRARATTIRVGSELKGPVDSVDAGAGTFTILGQTVEVRSTTVFDDSLGTSSVAGLAGLSVEVHALFDAASGRYVATRVEREDGLTSFKLRGLVASLDSTAKTFMLGAARISYANLADAALPAGFADGQNVRVTLATSKDASGNYVATSITSGKRTVDDHGDARVRGTVSAFTDATHFEVNGIPVDASNARIDDGPVTAGAYVDVRGSASGGTLVATRVDVKSGDDDAIRGVELHGAISGLDATARRFVLRELTVTWVDATVFERGSAAALTNGQSVEVKGVLSSDRRTLTATLIKFED